MGIFDNIFSGGKKPAQKQPAAAANQQQASFQPPISDITQVPNQLDASNVQASNLNVQPDPLDISNQQKDYNTDWYKNQSGSQQPVDFVMPDLNLQQPASQNAQDNVEPQIVPTPSQDFNLNELDFSNLNVGVNSAPVEPATVQPEDTFQVPDFSNLNLNPLEGQNTQQTQSVNSEITSQPQPAPEPVIEQPIANVVSDVPQNDLQNTTPQEPLVPELDLSNINQNQAIPNMEVSAPTPLVDVAQPEVNILQDNAQVESNTSEPPKPVLTPVKNLQNPSMEQKEKLKFKTVALLGLNGTSINQNISEDLLKLVDTLKTEKRKIIIDSVNGLGESVQNSLANYSLSELVVYMPLMSDLVGAKNINSNLSVKSSVFSNYIDREKYFIQKSDLFIILDSGGIHNYSILMTLWTLGYLYGNKSKQLILFGSNWNSMLESMKNSNLINDEELSSIHVTSNYNEVYSKLYQLSKDFYSGKKSNINDYRTAGDEMDFVI